jgi:F-type H+-transporting ATPase subunit gamma
MARLKEVQNRIKSVKSTRRITGAMEMVAAAKLRRAQQRVEQARPYAEKLNEMLMHLAAGATGEIAHPYFEEREINRKTLVVITSDRGFCGSFNANIIRRAVQWIEEAGDVEVELLCVGKKCHDYFKRRDWSILGYEGDWSGQLEYSRARAIVHQLTDRFVAGQTDQIDLLYTRFLSTSKYKVTLESYLPIEKPEISDDDENEHLGTMDYIFEPDPEAIYAALMPSYATTKMVTALNESFASEHGSRMIAMNNATKNAGEMIDRLTLDYNKARQAQITTELLEVVSGAEALKG